MNVKHRLSGSTTYIKWNNLRQVRKRGSGLMVTRLWSTTDGHGFGRFIDDVGPQPGTGWQLRRLVGTRTFCRSYAFWRPYDEPAVGRMKGETDPRFWSREMWPYQLTRNRDAECVAPGPERTRAMRDNPAMFTTLWPTHPHGLWWEPGDPDMFSDDRDIADVREAVTHELAAAQGVTADVWES
jgi:hypothetical protein